MSPTEDKQSIKKSGTIKNYSIDGFGSIEWKDSANQTSAKVKDLKYLVDFLKKYCFFSYLFYIFLVWDHDHSFHQIVLDWKVRPLSTKIRPMPMDIRSSQILELSNIIVQNTFIYCLKITFKPMRGIFEARTYYKP